MILKVKVFAVIAIVMLLGAGFAGGCGNTKTEAGGNPHTLVFTDLVGRQVELVVPVDSLVAIGPGALRLICYAGAVEQVAGVENFELQMPTGRPYRYANPQLINLPIIGQGGPDSSPDAEQLVSVSPDVIFVGYIADAAKADELQAQTGIPVVVISQGPLATFDEEVFESLALIGEITGKQNRADAVIAYIKSCLQDLDSRTKDIAEEEKPTVYAGALGMKGAHGIESTQANYPPFTAVNALNVVDGTGAKGSVMIEKEKLIAWNPDIIFIDQNGLSMVKEDYQLNPQIYDSLDAFKNGNVYGLIPFNFYTTNIDTAIADAYYVGKVLYPERFTDIDPAEKADEIYKSMLGRPLYDQIIKDFPGFVEVDFSAR